MVENKNEMKKGNVKQNEMKIKNENENENEIAISKLLLKLSSKIINLNENDLLRVIFLLGHRKVPIYQLRQAHIPNFGQLVRDSDVRGNVETMEGVKNGMKDVEKDVEVDVKKSIEVIEIKSHIEVEVEVKENNLSLLQVLDVQLYGMIPNLSPGKSENIKL